MKLQTPSSKLQRNIKLQAPNGAARIVYPEIQAGLWELQDGAAEGRPMVRKLQTPSSKIQTSLKPQTPRGLTRSFYPEIDPGSWELNDGAAQGASGRHPFDLEERTAQFGEEILRFCRKVPHTVENNRLIDQLVGCGTSVGANYCEASESVSRKDFKYSIGRCAKEAKETRFFLRMIAASEPGLKEEARVLYREAKELHLIFTSMYRK